MTFCIDDSAHTGKKGLPLKADGTVWNTNTQYQGIQDCETVVYLGEQGASLAEMCVALGVGKPTVARWAQNFPEFCEALEYARVLAESWWRRKGQQNLECMKPNGEKVFRSEIWKGTLEHEFGARSKAADVVVQVDKDTSMEEVRALVNKFRQEDI